ncbi:hypothetical protein [Dactylosporangium aurantiacum]|nr:hypothetical protein [Dactylosporangium aurantiacum]MDG6102364.1 hypothetical protein [Dactylosporangium aurantiacum]
MTTAIRARRCLRATRTDAASIPGMLAAQRLRALSGRARDTFRTLFGRLLPSAGGCVYCGIPTSYLPVSVARVAFAVHSDVMSSSGAERYYWCLSHQRVESEADMCAGRDRLGPYDSASEAEQALTTVQKRNEAWDAEDERWEGKH